MLTASLAAIAAGGLLNILLVLIVVGIIAAVAYWITAMFLPHPVPVLIAALVVVIGFLYALGA